MNTKINFAGIEMKNPVTVASGTFGYGREYSEFFDLSKLGAVITKGTSLKPRLFDIPIIPVTGFTLPGAPTPTSVISSSVSFAFFTAIIAALNMSSTISSAGLGHLVLTLPSLIIL